MGRSFELAMLPYYTKPEWQERYPGLTVHYDSQYLAAKTFTNAPHYPLTFTACGESGRR